VNNRPWQMALGLALLSLGCGHEDQRASAVPSATTSTQTRFRTSINIPERLTSVDVGGAGNGGVEQRVRCETCHAVRPPKPLPESMSALTEFHVGMRFTHGTLSCTACHAEGQPPKLKLATGEPLPTASALQLCAQCHGPQYRDYEHGAHGGMNGYWDTSAGNRTRNHCVDCHDPHTPQVEAVSPKPPPRDRFLNQGETH